MVLCSLQSREAGRGRRGRGGRADNYLGAGLCNPSRLVRENAPELNSSVRRRLSATILRAYGSSQRTRSRALFRGPIFPWSAARIRSSDEATFKAWVRMREIKRMPFGG
ncbi:hypothetical protein VULLAG_LOCUS11442 [Vulpes lagopus]